MTTQPNAIPLAKMSDINAHTPGPWAWFGNANSQSLYLATTHSGRRYVMGFKRWGMRGAQPQFQPARGGMIDAKDLLRFEVGDRDVVGVDAAKKNSSVYRLDVRGIDCPDARLIAAAPDLLVALQAWVSANTGIEDHSLTDAEVEARKLSVAAIARATTPAGER